MPPALCTAPPVQEQEPDSRHLPCSHGFLPLPAVPCLLSLHCSKTLRGCPFPCLRLTCPSPSHLATTPLHSRFCCLPAQADLRHTGPSVVVKERPVCPDASEGSQSHSCSARSF